MHPGPRLGPSRRPVDSHLPANRRATLAIGRWVSGTYDPVMSYDVHLFRFQRGECVDIDAARLMELIQPLIVWSDEEFDHVQLRAPDGYEADLYGAGEDASVLLFSHWCFGDICEMTAKLARELDMVIVPPDRPVMIIDERQRAHLPQEMTAKAVVVRTGTDIQRIIDPASLGEAADT
jgi:hypothetical protein